jgi:hypothetical protein
MDDKNSTCYVFSFGTGAIPWISKKQHAVKLSSTEVEYRAVVKGACEVVLLGRTLAKLRVNQDKTMVLFCDNQGVLKLENNPVIHDKTKPIDVHCHFNQQLVEDGEVELKYCPTPDQIVDIHNMSLGPDKFVKFRDKLGVVSRMSIKVGC